MRQGERIQLHQREYLEEGPGDTSGRGGRGLPRDLLLALLGRAALSPRQVE